MPQPILCQTPTRGLLNLSYARQIRFCDLSVSIILGIGVIPFHVNSDTYESCTRRSIATSLHTCICIKIFVKWYKLMSI
ncbi:hypothetical protein BLD44_026760 [Mastigocladus laminosus UU774]|nr:hypothetical protein B4U84_24500 [Westiellopsis prolifica IICB1]TFI51373.1 hypothetical protein BLD44_026760 [Mastigocladus laminosus UU774]